MTQPITAKVSGELNESELILASKQGDGRAAEVLFRRYHQVLFQVALRILRNREDAEDSLQDALLSAHCNLKRFEGRSQFSTWLTRIVINAALMKGAASRHGVPCPSTTSSTRASCQASAVLPTLRQIQNRFTWALKWGR